MKTMYVITGVRADGLRHLSFSNNVNWHFNTAQEAEDYLKKVRDVNPPDRVSLLGEDLKVLPVECYDHGDATRTVFPS